MKTRILARCLLFSVFCLSLAMSDVTTVAGAATTQTLKPVSYTTIQGGSGNQPVGNLAIRDQFNNNDDPSKYVSFTTPGVNYNGYRTYRLPQKIQPDTISTFKVKVNFKGYAKAQQAWTWYLLDWSLSSWVKIGDNTNAVSNTWTLLTFNVSNAKRFVSSTRVIRLRLQSGNATGDAKLDYEVIVVTYNPTTQVERAGLRASYYGISPWPSSTWWVNSIKSMASRFPPAAGSSILVVVEVNGASGPGCFAHFPNPGGGTYPGVTFDSVDRFNDKLTAFDANGIKAWLQVESSGCDMLMLIDLVLQHYGYHSSVIGFGVDDEWYLNKSYSEGKPITDAEAQAWVQRVRTHKAGYKVFLKHWLISHMPPTYRTGLVFVDDSQDFPSLNAMVTEFKAWGQHFTPSPVGFQFGYEADKAWWDTYSDPPGTIGNAIIANIPNAKELYWVDFTAYDIWPAP